MKKKSYHCDNDMIIMILQYYRVSECLERGEHGVHITRGVIIHNGEHNSVYEGNHVLRTRGWKTQQHVGAEHVKQENKIEKTGKIEHCRHKEVIIYHNKKMLNVIHFIFIF